MLNAILKTSNIPIFQTYQVPHQTIKNLKQRRIQILINENKGIINNNITINFNDDMKEIFLNIGFEIDGYTEEKKDICQVKLCQFWEEGKEKEENIYSSIILDFPIEMKYKVIEFYNNLEELNKKNEELNNIDESCEFGKIGNEIDKINKIKEFKKMKL